MNKLIVALFFGAFALNASAKGNVANGEALAKKNNCASCHGADYKSPVDPSYPKIAGQYPDYLQHALKAYKRGKVHFGRDNAIMGAMVQPLSDTDMRDIAAYLASLPGPLVQHR